MGEGIGHARGGQCLKHPRGTQASRPGVRRTTGGHVLEAGRVLQRRHDVTETGGGGGGEGGVVPVSTLLALES